MEHLLKGFLNVTEKATVATLPWVGKGDKNEADRAAVTSMRENLRQLDMQGVIVIGEGEIDEAPMLYIGEKVGNGEGTAVDIAVDPIDGTTPTSAGKDNGIAVIAAAPKGSLLHAPDMYMEKLAVGPEAAGRIDIEAPLVDNLYHVAKAKGKKMSEMNIFVQERPRHEEAVRIMKEAGATVHLFRDGDVIRAITPSMGNMDMDMFYNIGGAPEGVLSAVAINCLGGEMQARLSFRNDEEYDRCLKMGLDNPKAALRHDQLVSSEQGLFIATAITNTLFLKGANEDEDGLVTESLVIDGTTNAWRKVATNHLVTV
ncbi:class II fructose-bisphosphatase [Ornithinibacillus sp. L9]|uniref:Fructose-1,6-bisphosphatase n=1 Tax=Ornithinibacillus caprae TaxID=2678566 RepID=A0A6N8FER9_9BACI|nr:class II fructose-bisphosphatase [Ornithinibacillus caprae]